uniref:FA_desaturase domain-containing protein n=1 Tax=Panagrellus redivivus TaxID=6233 RepID=A0A7E4VSV9_PANRE
MAPPSATETVLETKTAISPILEEVQSRKLPTIDEVRKAIPPQCFEKNALISIYFLIQDYVIIAGLYWILPTVEAYAGWAGLLVWYWFTGMFMSSLFIIGHDCGHTTFSEYEWLNDICGHIAHAPILAPYWPWQKSHRQHHQYTSHVDKDKGHPWVTEEIHFSRDFISRHFSRIPISGFFRWNPVYTMFGLPDGSHFYPFSRLFTNNKERVQCVISGLACLFCAGVALHLCDYSFYNFVKYYYVPVLFQGFWMVMITYLQHQDEEIEVYEEGTWNYVRGQTQTIDRVYGFGMDSALHHITDGHVAHHFFFTKIPHYHLLEATEAIKKVLAPYQGAYKIKSNYDHLFEFCRLNLKLSYLLGRGTGVLKYKCSKSYDGKKTE